MFGEERDGRAEARGNKENKRRRRRKAEAGPEWRADGWMAWMAV